MNDFEEDEATLRDLSDQKMSILEAIDAMVAANKVEVTAANEHALYHINRHVELSQEALEQRESEGFGGWA